MNRYSLYWACQIVGWGVYVLLIALFNKLSGNQMSFYFTLNLVSTFLLGIAVSHVYRFFIIRWDWLKFKIVQLIPRVMLGSFTSAFAFFAIHTLVSNYIISHSGYVFNGFDLLQNLLNLSANFLLWTLFYWSFHFIQNFRKEEIKNLKWQTTIHRMELNKIKSQLNPHFIFNSMNSIRALVDERPDKAKNLITQLSNILRSSLYMERKPLIPFDEELSLVKDYLALEKTRLEERLDVKMTVADECSNFDVPPLLLQTLVENGIKHGISQFEKGGQLSFEASVADKFLKVTIINKGSINEIKNGKKGIGLDISKQRLKLLYGDLARFKITEEQGTVKAELVIPKESNKIEYESIDS